MEYVELNSSYPYYMFKFYSSYSNYIGGYDEKTSVTYKVQTSAYS